MHFVDFLAGLMQAGLKDKVQTSRKQIKERKNRALKCRGKKKTQGASCSPLSPSVLCLFLHGCQVESPSPGTLARGLEPQGKG